MEQDSEDLGQPQARTLGAGEESGRYVYCVAPTSEEVTLGGIGIDGREVHTIVYNGLCALVHNCPAQPYESSDPEVVAAWVLAHHRAVDAAWRRCGTVLPLTFNTIIKAEHGVGANENVKAWLETENQALKRKLEALEGKAEYGVQVFWDPVLISRQVVESCPEIRKLEKEIDSKPRGLAYMYRQKLEATLRKEMEARMVRRFQEVYGRIGRLADAIHVEKTKEGQPGHTMLMNLSCLLSSDRYQDLKTEMDRVSHGADLFVRLVGPLPPYSFC